MVVAVQAQIEDLYKQSTALDNEAQKITTEIARQRASKKAWAASVSGQCAVVAPSLSLTRAVEWRCGRNW
jgi:hypothetical protein